MKKMMWAVCFLIAFTPCVADAHWASAGLNFLLGTATGVGAGMFLKEAVHTPSIKNILPKIAGCVVLTMISHNRNLSFLNIAFPER